MNFEKVQRRKRKAISPVLATVILIAITLIAAIAIAGFVFGLFGTFTGGQNLQLVTQTCASGAGGAWAAGHALCTLQISNTGGASGSVTGCSLYGTAQTSGTPAGTAATVTIPAGTTASAPVSVYCWGAALTAGSAVSGSLVVASGSPLAFSAIAS
jgi:flagellin-like protein